MIRHLILAISSILLICQTGCWLVPPRVEPPAPEGVQPIWCQKLTIGTSPFVYNEGLRTPPIYDSCVIMPTTITSNIQYEDNRLCGVHTRTGEVKWMFPSDNVEQKHTEYIDGMGYIYNNYLVFKSMSTDPIKNDQLVCIDLNTNQEVWRKTFFNMTNPMNKHVVGYGEYCYFSQYDGRVAILYKANIISGDTIQILRACSPPNNKSSITTLLIAENVNNSPPMLIFYSYEYEADVDDYKEYKKLINYYDLSEQRIIRRTRLPSNASFVASIGCRVSNNLFSYVGGLAFCLDMSSDEIIWESLEKRVCLGMLHCNGVIISYGINDYLGLDPNTGKLLYRVNQGVYWGLTDGKYAYLLLTNENLVVIDVQTGKEVGVIKCPEQKITGDGFHIGARATIVGEYIYLMSYTSAYCYPKYPWK